MGFKLVVPPDYPEELQEICGLDSDQRRAFIVKLAKGWLRLKDADYPDLEIKSDVVDIIMRGEVIEKSAALQDWAERMDSDYLDLLDADADEDIVQPLFLRARFAASLSCAKDAVTDDRKLDELLYEYSFSREEGTDEEMLSVLYEIRSEGRKPE